jgi:phosphoglycolate phosphatase-like HAD superfamily hydrolase
MIKTHRPRLVSCSVLLPLALCCAAAEAFLLPGAGLAGAARRATRCGSGAWVTRRYGTGSETARMSLQGSEEGCCGFLLDFDGTVCDSVADTTQAAFAAATKLWPQDMEAALALDPRDAGVRKSWVGGDWSEYADDRRICENVPRWLQEKLRQLRPVVTPGSDAVLAARLCVTDAVNSKTSTLGERPLAAGEIVENWDVLRESMLYRVQYQPAELEESFADQVAGNDLSLEEWVDLNPVYPGVAASISKSRAPVYIMTRRDTEFTRSVLRRAGVEVPADRIIFVEQGRKKVDVLAEIASKLGASGGGGVAPLAYVDDNVNVVRQVVSDLRLASKVQVFFAEWGYSSPSQKAMAARFPRVTKIGLPQFAALVRPREDEVESKN